MENGVKIDRGICNCKSHYKEISSNDGISVCKLIESNNDLPTQKEEDEIVENYKQKVACAKGKKGNRCIQKQ